MLDDLDLEVAASGYIAITGASGAGKSTLLSILGGLGERADHRPAALSGGERRRVAMALTDHVPRAIELKPTVVTVWFTAGDRSTTTDAFARDLTNVTTQLKATGARVLLLPAAASQEQRRDPAAQTAIAEVVAPRVRS